MVKKLFSVGKQGLPGKSILERSFHYTPSVETDLRKTFARIREQNAQTASGGAQAQAATAAATKVLPIRQQQQR
jgi:hypothetical protein